MAMMNHREAGLTDDQARQVYRHMLLSRRLDERFALLQRSGAIPLSLSNKGHEAAQVGAAMAFTPGVDWWFPYYRDQAVVLVAGCTPLDLMRSAMGRITDPASAGRQTPYNWGDRERNVVSRSAPVAVQVPQAAGVALAARRRGDPVVVYCSFGDGAASQGDVHEGLNFAAVHRLGVVYLCQNNGYAISVPFERQMAGPGIAARAAGYGMPGVRLDGLDPFGVYAAAREAVDRARSGGGPTLLEVMVPRLESHTCDDNQSRYRSSAELAALGPQDPLPLVQAYLQNAGLLPESLEAEWEESVRAILDEVESVARREPVAVPDWEP